MKAELLDYALPPERIAKHPTPDRDGARLLVLEADRVVHSTVRELPSWVPSGALLVVNDTRVRKARIFGTRRPGGGRVELFLIRPLAASGARQRWEALGRANKPLRSGTWIDVSEVAVQVLSVGDDGVLEIEVDDARDVEALLEHVGHVPIPPYLGRDDEPEDASRYQTVYARNTGSVAAPTAGLHLTEPLMQRLQTQGRQFGRLALEVGLGTFRPVSAPDLDEHPMHSERYVVSEELAEAIRAARARGTKVVAVGTTVVRALESAADPTRPGEVLPTQAETRLLIQPGYRFRVVDALLTNFHQPRSTLLALVAAFAGLERVLAAYRTAVAEGYRFLSYGDAMWIPARHAERAE